MRCWAGTLNPGWHVRRLPRLVHALHAAGREDGRAGERHLGHHALLGMWALNPKPIHAQATACRPRTARRWA